MARGAKRARACHASIRQKNAWRSGPGLLSASWIASLP